MIRNRSKYRTAILIMTYASACLSTVLMFGCAGTTLRDGVLTDARAISSTIASDSRFDYRITLNKYVDPFWYDSSESDDREKAVQKRMKLLNCVPETIQETISVSGESDSKAYKWTYDIKCKSHNLGRDN